VGSGYRVDPTLVTAAAEGDESGGSTDQ
jgi:hypothetical protein